MVLTGKSCSACCRRSLHGAAFGQFLVENGLRVFAAALHQVGDRADYADADLVVGQGDVPEPRVPILGVEDQGRAFVNALVALAAAIVGVDRSLFQFRLGLGQLELAADQRTLTGGIDDDLRGKIVGLAVGELGAHAGGAVSIE